MPVSLWEKLTDLITIRGGVIDGEIIEEEEPKGLVSGSEVSVDGDEASLLDHSLDVLDDPPPAPTTFTAEIRASMSMDQISRAVGRMSEQIFTQDRGTMEYDGISDTFICHLTPNEEDKVAVGPLFEQAIEIWMVIDAHTNKDDAPNPHGWGL